MNCRGCLEEMFECYEWQQKGYNAGLDWDNFGNEHCFVFVLDKKREFIVK